MNNGAGASLVPIVRGGPQTPEGKEAARWNATRHGISSPSPVVPGLETQEDWQEYREAIMEHYSPSGPVMCELAERAALLTWRLRRVTRYEAEAIAISQEQIEDDFHSRESFKASMRGENSVLEGGKTLPPSLQIGTLTSGDEPAMNRPDMVG